MLNQQIRKPYNETLGTSVINSQTSPPSPTVWLDCYLITQDHAQILSIITPDIISSSNNNFQF